MKKLSVILLLVTSLLLTACGGDEMVDPGDKDAQTAATTTVSTTDGTDNGAGDEDEADPSVTDDGNETPEEPDSPEFDEVFADLMEKFPVVSAPTGSFASASSAEKIGEAIKRMDAWEGGMMQFKAIISMDMGTLGSQEEQIVSTLTTTDGAYQSITESTSIAADETYTTTEKQIFADGVYYYLYEVEGDDEFTEKYKIPLSFADFEEKILGKVEDEAEGIDEVELSQFTDMIEKALQYTAGMTQDGGCTYFGLGLSANDLAASGLTESFGEDLGGYLTEDCLSKIATVVTLDKDGDLKGIYFDLPIEFSIDEGGLSMTMSMSVQMEVTVRPVTADDKVEAPADAEDYDELTLDDILNTDDWFEGDWFEDEEDEI